jgi:hypothetical protein
VIANERHEKLDSHVCGRSSPLQGAAAAAECWYNIYLYRPDQNQNFENMHVTICLASRSIPRFLHLSQHKTDQKAAKLKPSAAKNAAGAPVPSALRGGRKAAAAAASGEKPPAAAGQKPPAAAAARAAVTTPLAREALAESLQVREALEKRTFQVQEWLLLPGRPLPLLRHAVCSVSRLMFSFA